MADAPKRIWATYDDAFGVNWTEGQFTTIEQPKTGRYVEYIRADLARPDLPESVGELVQWLLGLAEHYEDQHNFDQRNVARRAADALEALTADNAAKDAEIARLREGLGLIETEISSEETYNPNIAKIVRIALQEDDQ